MYLEKDTEIGIFWLSYEIWWTVVYETVRQLYYMYPTLHPSWREDVDVFDEMHFYFIELFLVLDFEVVLHYNKCE